MRNQAFPIHASILDEAADLDDNKPGSFFMKKLYVEKPEGQETQEEEEPDDDSDKESNGMGMPDVNGGKDSKVFGFCRTNDVYRAHYKIARLQEKRLNKNFVTDPHSETEIASMTKTGQITV